MFIRMLLSFILTVFLMLTGVAPGLCTITALGGWDDDDAALNNSGQIAGSVNKQAVIWEAGSGFTYLGYLDGGDRSYAYAINSSGNVTGRARNSDGDYEAFLWNGSTMTGLGIPDNGDIVYGYDINDSNTIAGAYRDENRDWHAVVWTESGDILNLGTLGGEESEATAVNNSNMVVGWADDSEYKAHAFLYTESNGMQDLGTLGGDRSYANDINDAGQVVGRVNIDTGRQAFLWEDGTMVGLESLNSDSLWTTAYSINNVGQIAGIAYYEAVYDGSAYIGVNHAVIWDDGVVYDLNDLIDPDSGWELTEAMHINDNGVILGIGTYDGEEQLYLLDISSAPDADGDGIPDGWDNCPATANADQLDSDNDGYGNLCDCDINGDGGGDGTVNMADYAVFRAAYGSTGDEDAGENWNADADFNGDLNVNMADYAIFRSRWLQSAPFE